MKLAPAYAAGAALALLVPIGLAGLLVQLAPAEATPQPTAYGDGPANSTAFRQTVLGTGFSVGVILAEPRLVVETQDATNTLVVVLAPAVPFDDETRTTLDEFLGRGGAVWIADGEGVANSWLSSYGAAITNNRLIDPTSTDPGSVELHATNVTESLPALVSRAPGKLFLDDGHEWEWSLSAPARVHLDVDGNGTIDRADEAGPHLVAAVRSMASGGRLIVSADDSILLDQNLEEEGTGNAAYVRALVAGILPNAGLVILDESSHGLTGREPYAAPIVSAGLALRQAGWMAGLGGLVALASGVGIAARLGAAAKPMSPHRESIPIDPTPQPPGRAAGGHHDTIPPNENSRTRGNRR